jgi:hypothetical protein
VSTAGNVLPWFLFKKQYHMDKILGILYISLAAAILYYVVFSKRQYIASAIKKVRSSYVGKFVPELWAIPLVSVILLYLMPPLMEWIDPTNHVVESEIYQFLPIACGAVIVINGFAFLGIRLNFKSAYLWYEKQFDSNDSPYLPYIFFGAFILYTLLPAIILAALI